MTLLDGFFQQKPPPKEKTKKVAIFSHMNPAHQHLLAVSDLCEAKQINKGNNNKALPGWPTEPVRGL